MKNTTQHTPGPWKVLPCPQHAGKHPCHDSRYIATDDAEVGWSYDSRPDQWGLNKGSLICTMRDGRTEANAQLIAAAPALLEALKALHIVGLGSMADTEGDDAAISAMEQARQAITQATGEQP